MSIPIDAVREVAQLLQESGLHEIVIESSEGSETPPFRLKMRRETGRSKTASGATSASKASKPKTADSKDSEVSGESNGAAPALPSHIDVASTAVGILRAPSPAVAIGDQVKRKQVIAIVESMKIPNEILAPADGTVVEILVRPESGVEYGQVLLRLEPTAVS
jgi:acetyl-CoA carboxylase biotin carboxyl carrier protein